MVVERRQSLIHFSWNMREGFLMMSFGDQIGVCQAAKDGKNIRGKGSSISKGRES